jgi:Kdo2-lipid IVA lauroyltransferase/acyltransferase
MTFIVKSLIAILSLISKWIPSFFLGLRYPLELLLQYVFRYRYRVIHDNLSSSFKSKNPKEIGLVIKQYYAVLARYIAEIGMATGWKIEDVKKYIYLEENPIWQEANQTTDSAIIMASHYGNWEINIPGLAALTDKKVIGFYKPLSNTTIDSVIKNLRSKYGLNLYPIEQTPRIIAQYKDQGAWFIFLSDQVPLNMNNVHRNIFLDRPTAWMNGSEKIAQKLNLPVYYLEQKPQEKLGQYTLLLHLIRSKSEIVHPRIIMERYTTMLQKEILHDPRYWLWSHRRWKRV